MSDQDKLARYRERRDFDRSPEPGGDGRAADDDPHFVIQEHAASSHHFDFRLEVAGVLASWAVPKGPSTDPSERRLAIRTEDHPLDYADFEGAIPEDEYGGGAVIVWDRGPYRNLRTEGEEACDMTGSLEDGFVKVFLEGEKLQGGFALKRTSSAGDDPERWLLVKMDDDHADARRRPVRTQRESVLSDRTVDDIETEREE